MIKAMGSLILQALGLLALSACAHQPTVAGDNPLATELLGGEQVVKILQSAETVEAYRLEPRVQYDRSLSAEVIDIVGMPVALSTKDTRLLVDILTDDDTYLWDEGKFCAPSYGLRVRFSAVTGSHVDVLFCFSCQMLTVIHNDLWLGTEDFDPRNDDLVALVKRLFPADEALQALR